MAVIEQVDQEQELKERLVQRIEQIHDLNALKGLSLILDSLLPKKIYITTPEEKEIIKERMQSLDAGNGIPHEIVKKEVREWLNNHPNASR